MLKSYRVGGVGGPLELILTVFYWVGAGLRGLGIWDGA